jgi:hypothetical protein
MGSWPDDANHCRSNCTRSHLICRCGLNDVHLSGWTGSGRIRSKITRLTHRTRHKVSRSMMPRQERDYVHAGSPLSATNRNFSAFCISSTVTIIASPLAGSWSFRKCKFTRFDTTVDNVFLAPFAAATKHFPDLVAFSWFHRKLPMFCVHRLLFRPGNSLTKSREFLENGVTSSGPATLFATRHSPGPGAFG